MFCLFTTRRKKPLNYVNYIKISILTMILFSLFSCNYLPLFVQMVYVLSVYSKKEKNHRIMVSGFSSFIYAAYNYTLLSIITNMPFRSIIIIIIFLLLSKYFITLVRTADGSI